MANLKDRWPSRIAEKFVPTSFWTQDSKGNFLLDIHLPGFKHEEVRIELPSADHIKIEGERIVNENKCIYMDHTLALPENSDAENILGKFEGDHLHVTVPKIIVREIGNGNNNHAAEDDDEEKESKKYGENQTEHDHDHGHGHGHGDAIQSGSHGSNHKESNPVEIVIKCLTINKGVALSALISFLIGVWVSRLGA